MTFPVSLHMAVNPAALVSVSQRVCVCHTALSACMIHVNSSFPFIAQEHHSVKHKHTDVYLTQCDSILVTNSLKHTSMYFMCI